MVSKHKFQNTDFESLIQKWKYNAHGRTGIHNGTAPVDTHGYERPWMHFNDGFINEEFIIILNNKKQQQNNTINDKLALIGVQSKMRRNGQSEMRLSFSPLWIEQTRSVL